MVKSKLKIGWFSFTCCQDNTIVFTELLNEHYFEWKKLIDIKYMNILKGKNDMTDLDVAFVEGAISSNSEAEEVKKVRKNCKKLVAVGACACTGKPSDARNRFTEDVKQKFHDIFKRFEYAENVLPVEKVVKVNDKIPGCPMSGDMFVKKLNEYLKEFKITT